MKNFLNNFYDVLFSPKQTFEDLKENPPIFQSFLIILAVSGLNAFHKADLLIDLTNSYWLVLAKLLGTLFAGVFGWLFWGAVFEMLAFVYNNSGKLKIFLTLFGFSMIPWLLWTPLNLLLASGGILGFFGVILKITVWVWTAYLWFLAISKSYNLSFSRVFALITALFICGIASFNLTISFFSTLIKSFY